MRKFFINFFVILNAFFFSAALYAEEANVTTYYSAPYSNYKDLSVSDSVTAGEAPSTAVVSMFGDNAIVDPLLDVLDVKNNLVGGWDPSSKGGELRVNGDVDIQNGAGNSLFFVNSANNRVGIGTRTPKTTLEVIGDVKGMIMTAHENTADWGLPWADIFAQFNGSDFENSASVNGTYARFASTIFIGDYRFRALHLDGNPLVFQTIPKAGLAAAGGTGQVVIRGYPYNPNPGFPYNAAGNDCALVVGEPDPAIYGGNLPLCKANNWNPLSSRQYKKDIMPLVLTDYHDILSHLAKADVVNFHYKMESKDKKLRTGFIAEDAPSEITPSHRKSVGLQDEAGFLLASLKALKIEDRALRERIERLKQWQNSGT